MGKVRTRTKKTSKGERNSISRSIVRAVRDDRTALDKIHNKLMAWKAGKKGWVTIANPNPAETDKPFIKVSFNTYFGRGRDYKTIKAGDRIAND